MREVSSMTIEKRDKIIQALLTEQSRDKACKVAGITTRTLRNYMQDADFVKAYREAVSEMLESTTRALQGATYASVKYLESLVLDNTAPISERRQASVKILEIQPKYAESLDILSRLDELERRFDETE